MNVESRRGAYPWLALAAAADLAITAGLACAGTSTRSGEPESGTAVGVPVAVPDVSVAADTAGGKGARTILVPIVIDDREPPSPDSVRVRIGPDTLPIHAERLSIGTLAQRELVELEQPATPASWLERHPEDDLTRFVRGFNDWDWWDSELVGEWCARAQRRMRTVEGRIVIRSAYFYPPQMPSPLVLPAVRDTLGADLAECLLGAVWVEFDEEPSASGEATSRAVAHALASRFGDPAPTPPLRIWHEKDWLERSSWAMADARYLVYYESDIEDVVRAGGWLPLSGIEAWGKSREEIEHEIGLDRARLVIATANLDSILAEPLLEQAWLGYGGFWGHVEQVHSDSTLINALDAWLSAANRLEPDRRAAALLVADLGMAYAHTSARYRDGASVREKLQSLGASFGFLPIGGKFAYTRNWLWDALSIDPWGPVREHALVELLEQGFNTTPPCGVGTNAFEAVIAHGPGVIEELRDPTLQARAHWLLARAYGDVVTIESGTDYEAGLYAQEGPWTGRALEARRLALEHYTKALESLSETTDGARIWREAWRLAAGLPPIQTRFVCIYD